jgi:hypothetical protein
LSAIFLADKAPKLTVFIAYNTALLTDRFLIDNEAIMSIRHSDVSALLNGLNKKAIGFNDVLNFIDDFYRYTPVKFSNGDLVNAVGQNEGSAKVFGFAKHHGLNQLDTLKLFAEHYDAVVAAPKGTDHPNIRNFIHWGWQGFLMEHNPLTARPSVDVKNI